MFYLLMIIGCTHPNSKNVSRETFVFTGFEEISLANAFSIQLTDFIQRFIITNACEHAIQENVWLVRPIQCKRNTESGVTDIAITPTNNFDVILKEVLQKLGISMGTL